MVEWWWPGARREGGECEEFSNRYGFSFTRQTESWEWVIQQCGYI